jgi:hypothetical protein
MSRQKAQPDEAIIAFFTTAPLDYAQSLLRLAGTIVKARQPTTAAPRKRRKDQGAPQAEGETK